MSWRWPLCGRARSAAFTEGRENEASSVTWRSIGRTCASDSSYFLSPCCVSSKPDSLHALLCNLHDSPLRWMLFSPYYKKSSVGRHLAKTPALPLAWPLHFIRDCLSTWLGDLPPHPAPPVLPRPLPPLATFSADSVLCMSPAPPPCSRTQDCAWDSEEARPPLSRNGLCDTKACRPWRLSSVPLISSLGLLDSPASARQA